MANNDTVIRLLQPPGASDLYSYQVLKSSLARKGVSVQPLELQWWFSSVDARPTVPLAAAVRTVWDRLLGGDSFGVD